jgi:predicted DNA-binding transcriptional regulator AlpA
MTVGDLIRAVNELEFDELPGLPSLLVAIAARMTEVRPGPTPAAADPDDTNLSVEEAAARLRRSTKWIYRRRGQLPFVRKLGPRSYVCSKNALERWLARQRT